MRVKFTASGAGFGSTTVSPEAKRNSRTSSSSGLEPIPSRIWYASLPDIRFCTSAVRSARQKYPNCHDTDEVGNLASLRRAADFSYRKYWLVEPEPHLEIS